MKAECNGKVKADQTDEIARISSNTELNLSGQSNLDTVSRAGTSSSQALSTRSLSPPSCFLSRLSFFPGNVSFRLNRATSFGSSRAYPASSTRFTISKEERELHLHTGPSCSLVNRNESSQGQGLLPACLVNRSPAAQSEDIASRNMQSNPNTTGFSDSLQDDQVTSALNVAGAINNPSAEFNVNNINSLSPIIHTDTENVETRFPDRRIGAQEPVERNVRFSRALSVGRLRDRVIRRSSFPEVSPLHQERELRDVSQHGGTQALGVGTGVLISNENALNSSTSSNASSGMSSPLYISQEFEVETSRAREARYHDILEHRSNFNERRRRIRSQVCKFALTNYDNYYCR